MLLAIWDDGVWQNLVAVTVVALVAYLTMMWIASLVWAYRDIQARTRDTFTQAMSLALVFIFPLAGLALYLILRPKETLAEVYDRQLEAEALLHEIQEQATCPTCRRKIQDDFIICPYCRVTLRTACGECSRPLNASWVVCPFCGADRSPTMIGARTSDSSDGASEESAPVRRTRRPSTATYTPPASRQTAQQPADPAVDA